MNHRLTIFVPGIGSHTDKWDILISRLKADPDFKEMKWMPWNHNCGLYSMKDPHNLALALAAAIDQETTLKESIDEITLIGHSMGGLLVRQAFLFAMGDYAGMPRMAWSTKVSRIVLLASLNRGLNPKNFRIALWDKFLKVWAPLRAFKPMLTQHLMRGSSFVSDLRIRWMRNFAAISGNAPTIVQILGNNDGIVTRADSVDLDQFPKAFHLSIADAPHRLLHRLEKAPDPEARYAIFKMALLKNHMENADVRIPSEGKQRIVFVLHGIRAANRDWVHDAEKVIRQQMGNDTEVVTPGYGYLSALEFAIPVLHQRPIQRFQNLYSDYLATSPGADFYFLGHSNGTYILGQSLKDLEGMRFKHIALAGSVLPRDFPWRQLWKNGQFVALRNDQSNHDVPVGILCNGLRGLGRRDVGVGGFEGFNDKDNHIQQYSFHRGGHSAALEENNLQSMVEFLEKGKDAPLPEPQTRNVGYMGLFSRLGFFIIPLLVVSIVIAFALAIYLQSFELGAGVAGLIIALVFILKVL